jgi:hypothetical protein
MYREVRLKLHAFLNACSEGLELVALYCTGTTNRRLCNMSPYRLLIKIVSRLPYRRFKDLPNKVSSNNLVYISITAQYLILLSDKHRRLTGRCY